MLDRYERFDRWLDGWAPRWLYDFWGWCMHVRFGPHNARVLCDMEERFGVALEEATRGAMSKAYYSAEAMVGAIRDVQEDMLNDSVYEYYRETKPLVSKAMDLAVAVDAIVPDYVKKFSYDQVRHYERCAPPQATQVERDVLKLQRLRLELMQEIEEHGEKFA